MGSGVRVQGTPDGVFCRNMSHAHAELKSALGAGSEISAISLAAARAGGCRASHPGLGGLPGEKEARVSAPAGERGPSGLESQESPRDLDPPVPKLPAYPLCCSNLLLPHLKIATPLFLSSFHVGSLINCALNISLKLASFLIL